MAPILGCGWCTSTKKKQAAKVPTSVELCSSARPSCKFTFAEAKAVQIEVLTALLPYRPCTQVLTSTREMDVFLVAFQKAFVLDFV